MSLRTILKINLIGALGALLLTLMDRSLRWRTAGLDGERATWAAGSPIILAFWHGRQLMMPRIYLTSASGQNAKRNIYVLISAHTDGRIIAKAMSWIGIKSVAGSSTRGGKEAFHLLVKTLQEGSHIGITPDGPKGPVHKLKEGVVRIAQRTGAPIYPAAFGAEKKWTFKSWDSMILPKPFSRAVMVMGDPVYIPKDCGEEDLKKYFGLVEDKLNQVMEKADGFDYNA